MLGLRGFPNVQGGVESHAEHLCLSLTGQGCDITVLTRTPYQPAEIGPEWRGIRFVSLWAPRYSGLEAMLHTFCGVVYAAIKRPDVLHIHAIGPAAMTLLARFLGLRVVVTHHGPDYDRQKWGWFARFVLKAGEWLGMRYSHQRIVLSNTIASLVKQKHHVDSTLIPNGVNLPPIPQGTAALQSFGLEAQRYVLMVSRLVPEKRHLDLIEAFRRADMSGWKLVLVGSSDHPDAYVQRVTESAANAPNVVMTGFQTGESLQQLFANAGMFVLPSSHEGLSIALLEALSYGLTVLASDIPANLEVGLSDEHYFALGDVCALADRLSATSRQSIAPEARESVRRDISTRYHWRDIAAKTCAVYRAAIHPEHAVACSRLAETQTASVSATPSVDASKGTPRPDFH